MFKRPEFDISADLEWWIAPQHLFDGRKLHHDVALLIKAGKIIRLADIAKMPQEARVWQIKGTLCPGFFDIQVNGGGGVLFNNSPTLATLETIYNAHKQFGTLSWLPTFITDKPEGMREAVNAVIEAKGRFWVEGIHLEGPYLNVTRKGTHKASYIRAVEPLIFDLVADLALANIPVLITLAPECVPAGTIAKLSALGAIVSAGHSAATAEQTAAALDEGLTCFTHLYNGMPQMTSRQPGIIGEALNSTVYCGIIADGHHVADQMLGIAIRSRKIPHHMILVTDAMSTIGGQDHFVLYDELIKVENGRLVNQAGSLAGAHIDMISSVKNLINNADIDVETAMAMATQNPATLMGLDGQVGMLKAGANANILFLNDDYDLDYKLINGQFEK